MVFVGNYRVGGFGFVGPQAKPHLSHMLNTLKRVFGLRFYPFSTELHLSYSYDLYLYKTQPNSYLAPFSQGMTNFLPKEVAS